MKTVNIEGQTDTGDKGIWSMTGGTLTDNHWVKN